VGEVTDLFPGLAVEGQSVHLRLFEHRERALDSHRLGVEALLLRKYEKDLRFMKRYLLLPEEAQGAALPFGGAAALEAGLYEALRREVLQVDIRSGEEYADHDSRVGRAFFDIGHRLREAVLSILNEYGDTRKSLQAAEKQSAARPVKQGILTEIREELARLVPRNFLQLYDLERLLHLPRYIEAKRIRAGRALLTPEKDRGKSAQLAPHLKDLQSLEEEVGEGSSLEKKQALSQFRWMVE
jgi:ATP-dependent helicase HrpA